MVKGINSMKTILFQGDSITDAGRDKENHVHLGFGYATLVKGEIGLDYPNEYTFINRGISGNRIVDVYSRIKMDILNLKPDIMSLLIGVNDVWHEINNQNGVEAEKFFKIYDMLISEIKQKLPDIKIIILEPFVLKASATEANWDLFKSEVAKRAEKAKEIAKKHNLKFVPLQDKLDEAAKTAPNDYWLVDGVHPSACGHEIIKREWVKAFKEL